MKRITVSLCLCVLILSTCGGPDAFKLMVPDAVVLQITAVNKMDTPVNLKIRHHYDFCFEEKETITVSSKYSELTLSPRSITGIGTETVSLNDGMETREETGFVLVDPRFNQFEADNTISSFELVFTAGDATTALAGYKTDDPYFMENGLVYAKISYSIDGHEAYLHTKTQTALVYDYAYVLPATLTINNDGTYLFEAVMQDDGIIFM